MTRYQVAKRNDFIVNIIYQHMSRENALSEKEIIALLNEAGYEIACGSIRQLIRKIILERKLPICCIKPNGYFWATTKEEIEDNIKEIESRINESKKRIEILKSFIIRSDTE